MATKVKFNGVDLMLDGEGNYSYSPGIFTPRSKDFEGMARAESLMVRELATRGAEHVVNLRFKGIDPELVMDRIRDAFDSGEGTLEVRGYPNARYCELILPPPLPDGGRSGNRTGTVKGMSINVSLVFMQVDE